MSKERSEIALLYCIAIPLGMQYNTTAIDLQYKIQQIYCIKYGCGGIIYVWGDTSHYLSGKNTARRKGDINYGVKTQ